jgi:hypothetical protein
MSLDTYLEIDTGGAEPATVCDIGNHTHNTHNMWDLALAQGDASHGMRTLDGMLALAAIPILEKAVSHIRHPDNAATYKAMNPPNGWGSHDSAAAYLERILAACREHPKARLRMSF